MSRPSNPRPLSDLIPSKTRKTCEVVPGLGTGLDFARVEPFFCLDRSQVRSSRHAHGAVWLAPLTVVLENNLPRFPCSAQAEWAENDTHAIQETGLRRQVFPAFTSSPAPRRPEMEQLIDGSSSKKNIDFLFTCEGPRSLTRPLFSAHPSQLLEIIHGRLSSFPVPSEMPDPTCKQRDWECFFLLENGPSNCERFSYKTQDALLNKPRDTLYPRPEAPLTDT